MADHPVMESDAGSEAADALVAESGSYDLLKKRLANQGDALLEKTRALNSARIEAFGRSEQTLLWRTRARTDNNCVARDLVRIGDLLLFGYNVFIGLRKETRLEDVFALYRLASQDAAEELEPVLLAGTFLDDSRFAADFRELYAYYKQASLIQLRVTSDKLLVAFQIGRQLHDLRVFRWALEPDGTIDYIDNRGERDITLPPTHDFEWTTATREHHVEGKHPHVNVLDTVFVETIGGDLTVKIENNTETGLGIYSEPVEDLNQSLTDAEIAWAHLGSLILLRIKPYRESQERYLVYNARTQSAQRIDAIGQSCVQLPEDHGIIFPGGYTLVSGESKRFDLPADVVADMRFKRTLRSPNGEDVLYVFYQPERGHYALFSYNLIEKSLAAPIVCNGYARFADGRILVFQASDAEPTRIHPMQLWRTPFTHEEHATDERAVRGFFGRIGNPELVRGIADLNSIARTVAEQAPTRVAYEDLIRQCNRVLDAYFWLGETDAGALADDLRAIAAGAATTLDEFEKVASIRRDTARALAEAESRQHVMQTEIASMLWRTPEDFVRALGQLREQRGRLEMLKALRYVDLDRIAALDSEAAEEEARVGEHAVRFLADETAFDPPRRELAALAEALTTATTTSEIDAQLTELDRIGSGLDLLTEQLGNLPGGDAVVRTRILDNIAAVYAQVNRQRAEARNRRRELGTTEAAAEFGAQFKLFGQAVENALELSDTPEKCDDALTRLLAQLEELEGRFADQDRFLADIADKREAVYEALTARRQSLLDARQRRSQQIVEAAGRILDGIPRRLTNVRETEALYSYFASDPLIAKLRKQIDDLRGLGASVAADDLDTRLRTARDEALRTVRDRRELLADDGNSLKFGRHAFTVNKQPLDLAIAPRNGSMGFHLNGTDYWQPVSNQQLDELKPYWDQALVSETPNLYRAEYLAGSLLDDVLSGRTAITQTTLLEQALDAQAPDRLLASVRDYAASRYQEGYQKGVHDHDATQILRALAAMQAEAGLLAYAPATRALALRFWQNGIDGTQRDALSRQARAAFDLHTHFGARTSLDRLCADLAPRLASFAADDATRSDQAARYLIHQLARFRGEERWIVSSAGADLADALLRDLDQRGRRGDWQRDLDAATSAERWQLACDWVDAYATSLGLASDWNRDAASQLAHEPARERVNAELDRRVEGLLGEHPRIDGGVLSLNLNDFWDRFHTHTRKVVPSWQQLHALRQDLVSGEKQRLRLDQFRARPLSSFVRNRLIDEVYLPLVGDNLAKQIGAAGDASRSDRMGLLLLISPPGYGKTTLMEYVADRLGMIFVRINGPALGHDIASLDPQSAGNSGARQELEKLNLGLAMGNNVMLYVDDIQHTSAEFLQKFIALADGTRRIEAVIDGEARTCDLRGKRFAIVMAGNPYTESGEVFRIPDMLANRADIYNLGDVLSGNEALFALSYIENALTANPVLLPLASRDPQDVHRLVRLAMGETVASSEFAHNYSAAELNELVALVKRLFRVRDVLLKVNLAYIASAAQADTYRTEPPFKLQGSYRNMAKLAARINASQSDTELNSLLRDHYRGEAQTLTTGAEENLLKLAELLGTPTADEAARWAAIREEYQRRNTLGGDDTDGSTRIAGTLYDIARAVERLQEKTGTAPDLNESLQRMADALASVQPRIDVDAPDLSGLTEAVRAMQESYDKVLLPLVTATYRKMRLDHAVWDEMKRISELMSRLEPHLSVPSDENG